MSPLGICADSEGAVWAAAARQPLFVHVLRGGVSRIASMYRGAMRWRVNWAGGTAEHSFV
jgi:hypothetical protein